MEYLLDDKIRLAFLLGGLFVLYAVEFVIPLVQSYRVSAFKVIPNVMMMVLLIATNFALSSFTLLVSSWVESYQIGLLYSIGLSNVYYKLVIGLIFLDLWAAYLPHILFHKIPWLWRFHAVHHSDTMIDVTTAFRQHPFETIFRIFFHLSGMVILGLPLVALFAYLSISALNAQLEHANLAIPKKMDRFLQHFYVTPNMHKVHHSKHQFETDSNYSNIFSVWDRLFGTYHRRENYTTIEYGLDYLEPDDTSVKNMLIDIPLQTKANQRRKQAHKKNIV